MLERYSDKDERIPLKSETEICNYQIEECIGAGGTSLVYKAKDKQDNKYVVIKEYYPAAKRKNEKNEEYLWSPFKREGLSLILKEGQKTGSFDSRNHYEREQFVSDSLRFEGKNNYSGLLEQTVLDTSGEQGFSDSCSSYAVMRTAYGKTLSDYIDSNKGNSGYIRDILSIIIEVVKRLSRFHNNGILHLDVTPGNIYLLINEDTPVPVFLDYGSSQLKDKYDIQLATCSIGFSAPEVDDPDSDITEKTDIFSIGAVLYYALFNELFNTLMTDDPSIECSLEFFKKTVDNSDLFSNYSQGTRHAFAVFFDEILNECPEERGFSSCNQLLEALNELLEIINSNGCHSSVIFDNALNDLNRRMPKASISKSILPAVIHREKSDYDNTIYEDRYSLNENGSALFQVISHEKQNIILISDGGAGKSVSMLFAAYETLDAFEQNKSDSLAVFIPVTDIKSVDGNCIIEYISDHFIGLTDKCENTIRNYFKKLKNEGKTLLVFIDGLNEVYNTRKLNNDIKDLTSEFSGENNSTLRFVISSRKDDDASVIPNCATYRLGSLGEDQIKEYLHNLDMNYSRISKELMKVLANPLNLTTYLKTNTIYQYKGLSGWDIFTGPDNSIKSSGEVMWNFFQYQILKNYRKDITVAPTGADLFNEDYISAVKTHYDVLPFLCLKMYLNNEYSISWKRFQELFEEFISSFSCGFHDFTSDDLTQVFDTLRSNDSFITCSVNRSRIPENIHVVHETIFNFCVALALHRFSLSDDKATAVQYLQKQFYSDEILKFFGEICGNQYYRYNDKKRIVIYSFEKAEYSPQKESLIGGILEKCRMNFEDSGICVRNLVYAVNLAAGRISGWDFRNLDFSYCYIEKMILSDSESASDFSESFFSDYCFYSIDSQLFTEEVWQQKEDRFIKGENLEIDLKTGLVRYICYNNMTQYSKEGTTLFKRFNVCDSVRIFTDYERFVDSAPDICLFDIWDNIYSFNKVSRKKNTVKVDFKNKKVTFDNQAEVYLTSLLDCNSSSPVCYEVGNYIILMTSSDICMYDKSSERTIETRHDIHEFSYTTSRDSCVFLFNKPKCQKFFLPGKLSAESSELVIDGYLFSKIGENVFSVIFLEISISPEISLTETTKKEIYFAEKEGLVILFLSDNEEEEVVLYDYVHGQTIYSKKEKSNNETHSYERTYEYKDYIYFNFNGRLYSYQLDCNLPSINNLDYYGHAYCFNDNEITVINEKAVSIYSKSLKNIKRDILLQNVFEKPSPFSYSDFYSESNHLIRNVNTVFDDCNEIAIYLINQENKSIQAIPYKLLDNNDLLGNNGVAISSNGISGISYDESNKSLLWCYSYTDLKYTPDLKAEYTTKTRLVQSGYPYGYKTLYEKKGMRFVKTLSAGNRTFIAYYNHSQSRTTVEIYNSTSDTNCLQTVTINTLKEEKFVISASTNYLAFFSTLRKRVLIYDFKNKITLPPFDLSATLDSINVDSEKSFSRGLKQLLVCEKGADQLTVLIYDDCFIQSESGKMIPLEIKLIISPSDKYRKSEITTIEDNTKKRHYFIFKNAIYKSLITNDGRVVTYDGDCPVSEFFINPLKLDQLRSLIPDGVFAERFMILSGYNSCYKADKAYIVDLLNPQMQGDLYLHPIYCKGCLFKDIRGIDFFGSEIEDKLKQYGAIIDALGTQKKWFESLNNLLNN